MIIKKTYGDDIYIIMNLTTIEFDKCTEDTLLIGKLIDNKNCEEFREYDKVCLVMDENIEVIEQ